MNISIVEESAISDSLDRSIRDSLVECFPDDKDAFSDSRAWHGSFPAYTVLIQDNNRVVAHVGIVDRTIEAGGEQLRVAGVQNVLVVGEYRGRGLSDQVLELAMDRARDMGFDCGLLFCIPYLGKVYGRMGWIKLKEHDVIRIDENGDEVSIPDKNIAMYFPLLRQDFPDGDIRLQGNDW